MAVEKMDRRTRVQAAFDCKPVDIVPVGFWYHFPEAESEGEMGTAHQLKFIDRIDPDFVKIMCDGFFDYPNEVLKKAQCAADLYHMKPLGKDSDFIRGQVERCKKVNEYIKGDRMTFYNVFNPMSSFRFGSSDELLMDCLWEDPKAMHNVFDVIAEDNEILSELVMTEGGCDGIYYCVQNAEEKRFTYDEYMEHVAPWDHKVLDYANSIKNNTILHCCGWAGDRNRMEVWKDYDAKVINWAVHIEKMSLAEGKEFFGGKCVLGGFDSRPQGVLYSGTKKEVEGYTEALLAGAGKVGVMLGGDCTLPRDVDPQRIRWVIEKVAQICK